MAPSSASFLKTLPPGPKSALWGTISYLRDPEGTVLALRRYGEPFTVPTLAGPIVVIWSPEHVRSFFSADPSSFAPFAVDSLGPVLGHGSILLQHGSAHRRSRRLLQPPFHGSRIRAYGDAIAAATVRHLEASPEDAFFPIEDTFRAISIDVIIQTVFGIDTTDRIDGCRSGVLEALAAFTPLLAMLEALRRDFWGVGPWARFRRLMDAVHEMLRAEIRARKDDGPGEDILSLLVAARDEDGQPMEEQEIIEQLFTMVVAGHETTATSLAWAINEILLVPGLAGDLRDALEPTQGDPAAIAELPLLDAVCSETLRRHPLAPMVSRRLLVPMDIASYHVPEGCGLSAALLLSHYREETFPEPEQFRPARFFNGGSFSIHEYYPWGGGNRRCLGAALAFYEMKVVLGTLLSRVDLELEVKARALATPRQATVGPKGGVRVRRSPVT